VILGDYTYNHVCHSINLLEIADRMSQYSKIIPIQRLIYDVFVFTVSEFDKSNHLLFKIDYHVNDFRRLCPR